MLIKVKYNGSCGDHHFKQGEEVSIPEEVVKALDPKDYEVIKEEMPAQKAKEEKSIEQAPADKQLKSSHNK